MNALTTNKNFLSPVGFQFNVDGVILTSVSASFDQIAFSSETGIVIGYVQSGKTLSFTTLTALARDNNYQIVIVIAGVSTNLVNQSTKRLEDDLRLHASILNCFPFFEHKSPSGHLALQV